MQDPDFAAKVAHAEGEAELAYTRNLAKLAVKGGTAATTFWLERRRPKDWREKVGIIDEERDVIAEEYEQLGEDDLRARLDALAGEVLRRRTHASPGDGGAGAPAADGANIAR